MIQINNIAQFKKALQVGREINVTHYRYKAPGADGKVNFEKQIQPTRKISIVQSNSFAIATEISTGEVVDGWMTYPRASEATFKNNVMTLSAKHPQYGNVILSVYSFPEFEILEQTNPAAAFAEILSEKHIINGKQCYFQF